jgi:hypothetical protein
MKHPRRGGAGPVGIYDRPDAADRRPKWIRALVVVVALGLTLAGYLLVADG